MKTKTKKPTVFIGNRFGKWVVIGPRERRGKKYKTPHWLCRCDCGRERFVVERNLLKGVSKRCVNCAKPGACIDEKEVVGTTIDNWIVLEFVGNNRVGHKQFLCRCGCGHTRNIGGCKLRQGYTPKCWNCIPVAKQLGVHRVFWKRLLWSAATRGFAVEVTMDYLLELLEKQNYRCAYTGLPIALAKTPSERIQGITTASVDRIDSSLGYIPSNLCWIHKKLNLMKGALPFEEFITFCRLVTNKFADCQDIGSLDLKKIAAIPLRY